MTSKVRNRSIGVLNHVSLPAASAWRRGNNSRGCTSIAPSPWCDRSGSHLVAIFLIK